MRIKFLLFFFFCMNMAIQAQSDKNQPKHNKGSHHKKWKRGFVVTVKGDTIYGKLRDKISPPFMDMQYDLAFDGPDGLTRHYTPDSINSFTLYRNKEEQTDTVTYVAIEVKDDQIGHALLRLYADGPCKIYGYTTIVATGMTSFTIVEYKYIRIEKGLMVRPMRIRFKKDMKELFSMCPLIVSKLESGDYQFNNWPQMVSDYNHGMCK